MRATKLSPGLLALYLCLAVLAALYCVPTFGVLLSSLKSTPEIARGLLWTWPDNFSGATISRCYAIRASIATC